MEPVALDPTTVYALSFTLVGSNPRGSPVTPIRIERDTAEIVRGPALVGGDDATLIGTNLWIVGGLHTDPDAGDWRKLYRFDPASLEIHQEVELPLPTQAKQFVSSLAGSPGTLWVGFGPNLYQLDPERGSITTRVQVDGNVSEVAVTHDGRTFYAVHESSDGGLVVTKRDPVTGDVLASEVLWGVPGGGAVLSPTDDGVWVSYATGMHGALVRLRSEDLKPSAHVEGPSGSGIGTNSVAGFVGGRILWVTDAQGSVLACADSVSGQIRLTLPLPGAGRVVADERGVFVASAKGLETFSPEGRCQA